MARVTHTESVAELQLQLRSLTVSEVLWGGEALPSGQSTLSIQVTPNG